MVKPKKTIREGASITLGNGEELFFANLTAWDLVATSKELGSSIDQADQFEASMVLAWRSSVQAGFNGDFQQFMEKIPFDQISEVVAVAGPFLQSSVAQVEPS